MSTFDVRAAGVPRRSGPGPLKLAAILGALVVAAACGDDASYYDEGGYWYGDTGATDAGSSPGNFSEDVGGGGESDASAPPEDVFVPEEEEELTTTPPTASRRYVFIASPSSNIVAKIDSITLAVTPIQVGREPSIVRTTPEGDYAVVLNEGSDTVSIIEASADRDRVVSVDILDGCNRLELSPSGTSAIAWYDNSAARVGDEIGSLQAISVVDLAEGEAYTVSVGFRIREIEFDAAGTRGFVVTDSGLNIVEFEALDGDVALPTNDLGADPLVDESDREVEVSQQGRYALVRTSNLVGLRIVDLEGDAVQEIELPVIPTDLDLTPDDALAIVALRGAGQIALIPLAEAIDDPEAVDFIDVEGVPSGIVTLSADGATALLHTSIDDDRRIAVLDLQRGRIDQVIGLQKRVRVVATSPDALRALVVHESEPGEPVPGEPLEDFVAKSEGVSLLDLRSGYAKLVLLPVEPMDQVFEPSGDAVWMMLGDRARDVRTIERLDLQTFARTTFTLDGLPESIGYVADSGQIYVSQESESGRLTFIDTTDGAVQHIAAYQLNAFIE